MPNSCLARITRRRFAGWMAAASLPMRAPAASEFPRLAPASMFISDCPLPGEARADGVFPAHPNGIQLSHDRWLILIATRGLRGTDDDRAIVWQLRRDAPDGGIMKQGFFARALEDWQPAGEARKFFKQHGHPVAFGVPRGARRNGRPVPHHNVFVVKWRTRGVLPGSAEAGESEKSRAGQGVEWAQFRLNDSGDDLEMLQETRTLRQKGFETGEIFCAAERCGWMNQTFTQAVPLNDDASEWVDCNHFANDRVAALRYRFNPGTGLYEWVETGPWLFDAAGGVSEASVMRWGADFIVCTRLTGTTKARPAKGFGLRGDEGIGWLRTSDLFQPRDARIVYAPSPACQRPRTAYLCADGRVRLFAGEAKNSPTRNPRDPLCGWDIDPDNGFQPSNRRVVFDSQAPALPKRKQTRPMADFVKVLPPSGSSQHLLHRVTSYPESYPPTPEEFAWFGIYATRLEFGDGVAGWDF